jgi:hypothetical protein
MHLLFINKDVLEFPVIEAAVNFSKKIKTYASLNSRSSARAHCGVVSECFNIIEFPRIIGEMHALNGIQNGEVYGVKTKYLCSSLTYLRLARGVVA